MPASARRAAGTLALALAASLLAPRASAQSAEELQAARELFQEAYKDEQEERYPEALEKFQRVAKVKESASVRYRIATVLAAMGRLREARDVYRAVAATKPTLPPSDQATADSAAEKAAELDRRIPKLVVRLQDEAPADARVTVDGAPVPVSTTPRSIELDPGEHVVAATATGTVASERTVTLPADGSEVEHTVTFVPDRAPDEVPGPAPRNKTLAWVAIGGGAALVTVGGVLLILREGTIDDIKSTCPGNVCLSSQREEIESDRARASTFGPVGGVLGLAGLVAIGAGVYLLVRQPVAAPAATTWHFTPRLGGGSFRLTF